MSLKSALLENGSVVEAQRPWPRIAVDADGWRRAILAVAQCKATMVGLWSDGQAVHMGLAEEPVSEVLVVSLICQDRSLHGSRTWRGCSGERGDYIR